MATRYVNTASTTGGDGTTNATSGANRAYPNIVEWEAARQAVLSEVEECICEGTAVDAPATGLIIDGWTTSAANYIDIKALSSASAGRHAGVWSTSKYRIDATVGGGGGNQFWIMENYVRVTGIQIRNTGVETFDRGISVSSLTTPASSDIRLEALIVRDCGGHGIDLTECIATVRNCVSYGNTGDGVAVNSGGSSATVTCDNCVSAGNTGLGFSSDAFINETTLRNCYAGGNTGADISALWDTITTCRSEDGSQSTTVVAYSTSSGAYFTNITPGSEDFHIGALSALKDAGTDLSGTFTTDIDGQTRPTGANTWDIGADEIVSGVAAAVIKNPIAHLERPFNMTTSRGRM